MKTNAAFTLLELLLVVAMVGGLLLGVYGFFHKAVKTRNGAEERIREMRLRERATAVIRDDLRNLYLSGGPFAGTLEGGKSSQRVNFPGYLRFAATTGRDAKDAGDVQRVEYKISEVSEATTREHGPLVRTVSRDFLDAGEPPEEELMPEVREFEVAFLDAGDNWQENWQYSGSGDALPRAVKLRIMQSATGSVPMEIFIPVTLQSQ